MRRWFMLLTLFITVSLYTTAQLSASQKNYFRNPLGIPMQLSANFGELRPNHWHMGLDIRTNAKENQPVYAAADGYIAKVGIRPQSFGRFIIINHPNGLSTLYAHLNDFYPALEEYVTQQQYEKESWAVELNFKKDQFPVYKSSFIAYSGNTGGSQGPHLHFEIMDTKSEKRLNPLLFNFPIEDETAPSIVRLALYDRSRSIYGQTPVLFSVKNTDSGYIIPKQPLIKTGFDKLSFAIQASDRMTKGGSDNGIYKAAIYKNGNAQIQFILDSIDYIETAAINSHIDYRYDYFGGPYLQHLSQMPGDHASVYHQLQSNGIIELTDTTVQEIMIQVKDTYGNESTLKFSLQWDDSLQTVKPADFSSQKIIPNHSAVFDRPDFKVSFPAGSIYDTVPLFYFQNKSFKENAVSFAHQLNDPSYPLHENIKVRIRADKLIQPEWSNRLIMQRTGKGSTIRKVKENNGWMEAEFDDFGTFQVIADLTPPQINELGKADTINLSAAKQIVFSPTDNFGMVKNFRVELDGKWLRFTNDKSRNWIYKFDERCPYGVHELVARAEDLAGNSTEKRWWFRREPYTPPPKKAIRKKSKPVTKKKPVVKSKKK